MSSFRKLQQNLSVKLLAEEDNVLGYSHTFRLRAHLLTLVMLAWLNWIIVSRRWRGTQIKLVPDQLDQLTDFIFGSRTTD